MNIFWYAALLPQTRRLLTQHSPKTTAELEAFGIILPLGKISRVEELKVVLKEDSHAPHPCPDDV